MRTLLIAFGILAILGVSSCASYNQERSAAAGAALGGGAGAIIGHQFGQRDAGALIGGALGGTAGLFHGQNEDARQDNRRYGGGPRSGGGDDFRNPYSQPDQKYCRGRWTWDAPSAYWLCQ